ncbi:MAG: hypothetical protein ACE149_01230 [Armatimonadota bacterium]
MRKLKRREKRLVIVLCAVVVLGATSFYMAPQEGPNPEEVMAYYIHAFQSAQQITVRTPDGRVPPVTLTREKDRHLFSRLESLCRLGRPAMPMAGQPPVYLLDIAGRDGKVIKDVAVGLVLDSPEQPARGRLSFIPREMNEEGPVPVMALAIEERLDPKAAKAHWERVRQQVAQWQQQRGGVRGRGTVPGRSPGERAGVARGRRGPLPGGDPRGR